MTDDPIVPVAPQIMKHVNDEHVENMIEYLRAFTDVQDATFAMAVAMDRHGMDIEAETPGGKQTRRIGWSEELTERPQVREQMVRLTNEAHAKLGITPPEHHGAH